MGVWWRAAIVVAALAAAGCSTDRAACDPKCDASACQVCDESGDEPVCVSACGDEMTCESGVCLASGDSACQPECTECSYCDTSGATATCVDPCGEGTTCNPTTRVCDPVAVVDACDDACDAAACEVCDESLATPACVSTCGDGTECVTGSGVCAPLDCPTPCEDGEYCLIEGDTATCVTRAEFVHATVIVGPFESPLEITATCLACHEDEAVDLMQTPHWSWDGDAPNRAELDGTVIGGTFGKRPSINNFCVAVDTNEARCTMCHTSYGWGYADPDEPSKVGNYTPAGESALEYYASLPQPIDFLDDPSRIDCLVCHSASSKYQKGRVWAGYPVEWDNNGFPGDGRPVDPSDPSIVNASPGVLLETASALTRSPGVGQCGRCHFAAGGGDNVKKGDIGSTLRFADNASTDPVFAGVVTSLPKDEIDVHMGGSLSCVSCHQAAADDPNRHRVVGQGVHNVPSAGRVRCTEGGCHDAAPHQEGILDNHALDVACQTCHVPTFSNAQPTKMYWDWTVAGDRTGAYDPVTDGLVPANPVFDSAQTRTQYDWKKGAFVWAEKVTPNVAWFDGRAFHLSITDTFDDGQRDGSVLISAPVAAHADDDAKIFPFKVMRGKQFADITTSDNNFLIVPELFGPGGFWGRVAAGEDMKPGASVAADAMWDSVLTQGAQGSGQTSFFGDPGDAYPTERSWGFVDTELWMLINHEVAPASKALGGSQSGCDSCHGASGWGDAVWLRLGYSCDPLGNPGGCGSRN